MIVCCSLFVVVGALFFALCPLLVAVPCSLFVVRCFLRVVSRFVVLLLVARCSLFVVRC